jgi:hypothetical protein
VQLMSRRADEKSSTLIALTSSALLLPAYQGVQADAPPEFAELGVRYSKYEEDDISSNKAFGGSSERYEIDVAQFHLLAPVADDWSVALDVQWEDMSGASPWFVGESAGNGDPKVIMSGASIEDTRTEVTVATRYYFDRGSAGASYSYSDEDDYQSDAFSLDGSFNSEDGMTTYAAAMSASNDDIEPTQGAVPTNTLEDEKDIRSAWIGVTRIVSRQALVRFGLSYTYRDGYLTDPYKNRDSRPDERMPPCIWTTATLTMIGMSPRTHWRWPGCKICVQICSSLRLCVTTARTRRSFIPPSLIPARVTLQTIIGFQPTVHIPLACVCGRT